jgi:hypothetical protein
MALAVAFYLRGPETCTSKGIKNVQRFALWNSMFIFTALILE